MKVHAVNTTAVILLGNGERHYAPITMHIDGDDVRNQVFKAEKGASIGFGNTESVKVIGDVYKVGEHPDTSFMGVKFKENTITKVYKFDTNNLSIYITNGDNYNISYGHLQPNEQKRVVDNFFNDLKIRA